MTFIEAYAIFNIWSVPIDKVTFPVEWDVYASRSAQDSVLGHLSKYEFLNDSLVKDTEWDSVRSTGSVYEEENYWGLNNDGRIGFISSAPVRDSAAKIFLDFKYENGLLMKIVQYDNGTVSAYRRFEYEGANLARMINRNLAKKDSTVVAYTWSNGRIVGMVEDFGDVKYGNAFTYLGDGVAQRNRTVLAGSSSASRYEYFYENGRLAGSKDFDVDRLSVIFHFRYGGPMGLSGKRAKAFLPTRQGGGADVLGRMLRPAKPSVRGVTLHR